MAVQSEKRARKENRLVREKEAFSAASDATTTTPFHYIVIAPLREAKVRCEAEC